MQGTRKALCWFFAVTSFVYLRMFLLSILYSIHRQYAFPTLNLFVTVSFWAVVATISGAAWWAIWKGEPSARGWGIAASLVEILIFLKPIIFSLRFIWWYHVGVLYVGIVGLVTFLRRDEQHDPNKDEEVKPEGPPQ
jgi:hypothetical protein